MMTEKALAQKERQLALLIALDRVRDSLEDDGDPAAMIQQIVILLKKHFSADACAIMLVDTATHEPESVAAVSVPDDMALLLCQDAMQHPTPKLIDSTIWDHTLGVQIVKDENQQILGGLFIARKSIPFSQDDIELLSLSESQIDSSVIQSRMIWKLAERNRELESVYQIDLLRDNAADEDGLINSFTMILVEQFQAELCMVIVRHAENNDLIVRELIDKFQLEPSTLKRIQNLAMELRSPQLIHIPQIEHIQLLAAPFIVSGTRLGAVVVGRKRKFTVTDNRLIFAMMSQMDSAVVKHRLAHQLEQRNRELEAIYHIDQIRDMELDFDTMLQRVLHEMCAAVQSETGYLMLYNADSEEPLELKATTTEGDLLRPEYIAMIQDISRQALHAEQVIFDNQPKESIRSIIATPLILKEKIIGVFGAINSHHLHGFMREDVRMLSAITSQVDTAVFERLERRRMRRVLSRSVDPKVLDALLQRADDNILAGERVVLSVLFADLRGSTEWAERIDPEEFVMILNTFLGEMTEIIFKHGGTLDKFVGDEVIALFGSPVEMEDHAFHAVQASLEMQEIHRTLQVKFQAQGKELPAMGIGISSGEVIAGEFGPSIRTDFTAMGRVMNLGARLCSAATADQIIISPESLTMLGGRVQVNECETIELKGINKVVPIYELLGINE